MTFLFCTEKVPKGVLIVLRLVQLNLCQKLLFLHQLANPQDVNILFIELQVQYVKIPSSEYGENVLCTEVDFDIQNNLFAGCLI